MLLIASLSLYASYTANIVALLQSSTDSIKTLSDLLDSPLKLAAQDVIYNRYYFKVPSNTLLSEPSFRSSARLALTDRLSNVVVSRPGEESHRGSKDRAEGAEGQLDEHSRGDSSRQERAVRDARGARHGLQDHTRHVPGGREVRHHGDQFTQRFLPADGDPNSVAVQGDHEKRVRIGECVDPRLFLPFRSLSGRS